MKKILAMVVFLVIMTISFTAIGEYYDFRDNTFMEIFNYDFDKAIENGTKVGYDGYAIDGTIYSCCYSRMYLSDMTNDAWTFADADKILKNFLETNGCENVEVNIYLVGYYAPDERMIVRVSVKTSTDLSTFDNGVDFPYYGLEVLTTFW